MRRAEPQTAREAWRRGLSRAYLACFRGRDTVGFLRSRVINPIVVTAKPMFRARKGHGIWPRRYAIKSGGPRGCG